MKVKVGVTLEPETLRQIEEQRGIIKRSTFIDYLIKLGLQVHKKSHTLPKISKTKKPVE